MNLNLFYVGNTSPVLYEQHYWTFPTFLCLFISWNVWFLIILSCLELNLIYMISLELLCTGTPLIHVMLSTYKSRSCTQLAFFKCVIPDNWIMSWIRFNLHDFSWINVYGHTPIHIMLGTYKSRSCTQLEIKHESHSRRDGSS